MKPTRFFSLLFVTALVIGSGLAQEATLEDVLQKHYEAIGGLEAWQSLQTLRASGTMSMGPMEAPVKMTAKRPNKIRIDFEVQGMTGTQAYDGNTAWMLMPFMGKTDPEALPADQAKALVEEADIDGPLIGYDSEGQKLELEGKVEVEGTSAYKIKVTRKSGDVLHYYLDSEYYIPIRVEGTRMMQGKELQFETTLSDYKDVNGLMMAHSIVSKAQGAPGGQTLTLTKIETDIDVDDAD